MKKFIKIATLGALLVTSSSYAVSTAGCTGCHGQNFENAALGMSKVVKDMSLDEVIASLEGYKNGSYGGAMKSLMMGQVASLSSDDIKKMSMMIKGVDATASVSRATTPTATNASHIDLNTKASNASRIANEDLNKQTTLSERVLGLRKTDLYTEYRAEGIKTDYSRPAPGMSTPFERAFRDAPPMIPHSVEGLLPITRMNNQCIGCHLPAVASSIGATAIPESHFTNYRPSMEMDGKDVIKEGHVVGRELGNSSDILIAKAVKSETLYAGRFNCTQCHAPQSKTDTVVGNTFRPDFSKRAFKTHSSLADAMNEGIE